MLCDFHRAKSIPIMALWSSGMIPPSGKTLVKCSKHGGGPDFDYRQSPFLFCCSIWCASRLVRVFVEVFFWFLRDM
jgi:hypothetical protein